MSNPILHNSCYIYILGVIFSYQSDGMSTDSSFSRVASNSVPKVGQKQSEDLSFCLEVMIYLFKPSVAYVLESGRKNFKGTINDEKTFVERFHVYILTSVI